MDNADKRELKASYSPRASLYKKDTFYLTNMTSKKDEGKRKERNNVVRRCVLKGLKYSSLGNKFYFILRASFVLP